MLEVNDLLNEKLDLYDAILSGRRSPIAKNGAGNSLAAADSKGDDDVCLLLPVSLLPFPFLPVEIISTA